MAFALRHGLRNWSNATIPYEIWSSITANDPNGAAVIHQAMAEISAATPWRFVPRRGHRNYVAFERDHDHTRGGSSEIGCVGGLQCITLDTPVSLRTVVHEIGHAIGLQHEHCRPDRDWYAQINWHLVSERRKSAFAVKTSPDDVALGAYDSTSVMHYDCGFGPSSPTIRLPAPVQEILPVSSGSRATIARLSKGPGFNARGSVTFQLIHRGAVLRDLHSISVPPGYEQVHITDQVAPRAIVMRKPLTGQTRIQGLDFACNLNGTQTTTTIDPGAVVSHLARMGGRHVYLTYNPATGLVSSRNLAVRTARLTGARQSSFVMRGATLMRTAEVGRNHFLIVGNGSIFRTYTLSATGRVGRQVGGFSLAPRVHDIQPVVIDGQSYLIANQTAMRTMTGYAIAADGRINTASSILGIGNLDGPHKLERSIVVKQTVDIDPFGPDDDKTTGVYVLNYKRGGTLVGALELTQSNGQLSARAVRTFTQTISKVPFPTVVPQAINTNIRPRGSNEPPFTLSTHDIAAMIYRATGESGPTPEAIL